MPKDVTPIEVGPRGQEEHPAFGLIRLSRVSYSPPGKVLFDSDIRHQHYVVLRVDEASRKRDLNSDWIHGGKGVLEIAMSEAQWAAAAASFGSSGTPCTIEYAAGDGERPGIPYETRLSLSHREVGNAAEDALAAVMEAFQVAKERPTKANMRSLEAAIGNAPKNMEFAAKQLTAHTEKTVQKAKADIEAMVVNKAQQLGLTPESLALEIGETPRFESQEGSE